MSQTLTAAPAAPVQRVSLADQIREVLARRIANGDYPPGFRLVEMTIAKELGTSQAPVREALRALETMRLVESQAHRGTRVREISEREMVETHFVRGALEEAAARAAGAGYFRDDPVAVEALRSETDAMRAAEAAGDLPALTRRNYRFHRRIVLASGCSVLIQSWEALGLETRSAFTTARHAVDNRVAIAQHDAITDALAAGDGESAGRLLREHSLSFSKLHEQGPHAWSREARRTVRPSDDTLRD